MNGDMLQDESQILLRGPAWFCRAIAQVAGQRSGLLRASEEVLDVQTQCADRQTRHVSIFLTLHAGRGNLVLSVRGLSGLVKGVFHVV